MFPTVFRRTLLRQRSSITISDSLCNFKQYLISSPSSVRNKDEHDIDSKAKIVKFLDEQIPLNNTALSDTREALLTLKTIRPQLDSLLTARQASEYWRSASKMFVKGHQPKAALLTLECWVDDPLFQEHRSSSSNKSIKHLPNDKDLKSILRSCCTLPPINDPTHINVKQTRKIYFERTQLMTTLLHWFHNNPTMMDEEARSLGLVVRSFSSFESKKSESQMWSEATFLYGDLSPNWYLSRVLSSCLNVRQRLVQHCDDGIGENNKSNANNKSNTSKNSNTSKKREKLLNFELAEQKNALLQFVKMIHKRKYNKYSPERGVTTRATRNIEMLFAAHAKDEMYRGSGDSQASLKRLNEEPLVYIGLESSPEEVYKMLEIAFQSVFQSFKDIQKMNVSPTHSTFYSISKLYLEEILTRNGKDIQNENKNVELIVNILEKQIMSDVIGKEDESSLMNSDEAEEILNSLLHTIKEDWRNDHDDNLVGNDEDTSQSGVDSLSLNSIRKIKNILFSQYSKKNDDYIIHIS
jgi:hypothetical protein